MSSTAKILVLDDEPNIVEVIITRLESIGFRAVGFTRPEIALNALKRDEYHVLITDLKMPDMDGMQVLHHAKQIDPDLEVIIFTAYGSIDGAVQAMKQGAHDYLVKPFEPVELIAKIESAIEKRELKQRVRYLEQEVEDRIEHHIYAESQAMKKVLSLARQVSKSDANVLILGESGTGKELIAKMLHYESNRRDRKFVIMDCGATPPSLIEAELFGYTKGAYTGAVKDKRGIIEEADTGTLFLDEIGDMPLLMQTKLLSVLQERSVERVGGTTPIPVDVRVIAATNRNLEEMIRQNRFRQDLYYRLDVVRLALPPLRQRRPDIPLLVRYFVNVLNNDLKTDIREIHPSAIGLLQEYDWPGNVRELYNLLEQAINLARMRGHQQLTTRHFPSLTQRLASHEAIAGHNLNETVEEVEKRMIQEALHENGGNKSRTAKQLGIHSSALYRKLAKYNLN